MKLVVVKVGTNVLTNKANRISGPILKELVRQIAELYERDIMTVLVSSGSTIAGKEVLSGLELTDSRSRQQVFSSVGQPRLMRLYYNNFHHFGMRCAQILATKQDFEVSPHRKNLNNCFQSLLEEGIIPITNEDDATSLKATLRDNDELASWVSELLGADKMILMTDTDGLYNGDPEAEDTEKFSKVKVDQNVEKYVQPSKKKEGEGRGGMESKLKIAKSTAAKGIPTVITNGKRANAIVDIVDGKDIGTKFIA